MGQVESDIPGHGFSSLVDLIDRLVVCLFAGWLVGVAWRVGGSERFESKVPHTMSSRNKRRKTSTATEADTGDGDANDNAV